jgi:2-polyprenyl-3-methyl-5-hydroxy-6-metoxy-1,4-benzoquinol methylase
LSPDQDRARRYFDRLAPEYDRAFRAGGRDPLNAPGLVNRLFRGRTFRRRMRILEALLGELRLPGKSVLDLGCGSGQVSLLAASLGAEVTGLDIAPRMLAIARRAAEVAGLAGRIRFEEADVTRASLPEADVVLLVGVVEYYESFEELVRRAAAAARETLVVAHTNRVLYRMFLRRLLFSLQGGRVYFHPMSKVEAAAEGAGLRLASEIRTHAFTVLVLERPRP